MSSSRKIGELVVAAAFDVVDVSQLINVLLVIRRRAGLEGLYEIYARSSRCTADESSWYTRI